MSQMLSRRMLGEALAITALMVPGQVVASSPSLSTPVPSVAPAKPETRTGVIELAGKAYAYLPKGMDNRPRPLLVSLYGAGGQASAVLDAYREFADREGFILMIPTSRRGTWDMIEDLKSRIGIEMNVTPRYGKDLKAIDAALAELFTKIAVDPKRIGIVGFSDGATYALSIGTANPHLFRTVIAFSPGPAFPTKFDPNQNVFISHGENDDILPYANTRGIVSKLRVKKMPVTFEKFSGKHEVPRDIREKALALFMGKPLGS
ncbi:MAG: dienelactone hydrolase family protein [Sphingomicrobium sp.]